MKLFIYFIYFLLFNFLISFADDCGQNTNCPHKKSRYFFCQKDEMRIGQEFGKAACVYNPDDLLPDLIPMKLPLPVCLSIEKSSFKCKVYQVGRETGMIDVLFEDYMQDDCSSSANEWMCLCDLQDIPCACEIKVCLSSDINLFPNVEKDIAVANWMWNNTDNKCEVMCNAFIAINNTKIFTGSEPNDCLKRRAFVINDKYIRDNGTEYTYMCQVLGISVYNLTEILIHEIGHIMGLAHHTESDDSNPCNDVEGGSGGLMGWFARYNYGKKGEFTNDDICQFKKLYCPDLVGVNDYNSNKDKKSKPFPNPSEDITNISFSLNSYSETTILYVYNYLGNTVKILDLKNLDFSNEEHIIQVPTNDLAPGQYFYKIVNETTVETGKFIIVR